VSPYLRKKLKKIKKERKKRAGDMAQVKYYLSVKHEDLSTKPSTTNK
jgi:hypothetical protein